MDNVISLHKSAQSQLRNIADMLDRGEIHSGVTVICGTEVFHCDDSKKDAGDCAADVIFNCNFAIHKLMSAALNK